MITCVYLLNSFNSRYWTHTCERNIPANDPSAVIIVTKPLPPRGPCDYMKSVTTRTPERLTIIYAHYQKVSTTEMINKQQLLMEMKAKVRVSGISIISHLEPRVIIKLVVIAQNVATDLRVVE